MAPDAVCFSGNYLANIPEIIDLAKSIKAKLLECFVFVGGHSASFVAVDLLRHAEGAIDCVLKGEGEAAAATLLAAVGAGAGLDKQPLATYSVCRAWSRKRAKDRRPALWRASTKFVRPAIFCGIGANISSAHSIPAHRSNSRVAVLGTALSAALDVLWPLLSPR
ncbi:cobalamin-dependent protein [Acidisoma sp. L85]|uniref:cobalamin-dependent protein n=1 Tax=Acidisoma sp. L85 TaxID=1641850 RepID=UPI0020B12C49|nr:cobalamin-dependent protein [Acidisoma sp. L85]